MAGLNHGVLKDFLFSHVINFTFASYDKLANQFFRDHYEREGYYTSHHNWTAGYFSFGFDYSFHHCVPPYEEITKEGP